MATQDRFTTALRQNKAWAAQISKENPDLFRKLSAGQHPEILWIGCSDSRCPETTLLGLNPGDVFVHRNIANILQPSDLSSTSVIEYAVRHLGVKHVVVCGHTNCGGVSAVMANKQLGVLDSWLLPLRKLRDTNASRLKSLPADKALLQLVELNVLAGVKTVKQKSVVAEAMKKGLKVHGLVYDVGSGVLQELDTSVSDKVVRKRLTLFKKEV
ncbi:carbonic anhydrase [Aspergillus mulundensis]|uniref:Carbonic anhydrase n=1 Tax=Aspergillus mulundensis TaxID=1810919 RepID=A0A3D8QF82_9EURO|nr:Carbonic anhydrase [Aspergillus mulundensis]RDW60485.1 Carbonic anhydrase [Aspergillus mulundensis]